MLNFTPTQFTSTTNIYSEPIKTASMWNSNEASAHPSSHAVTRVDNNFGSVIRNPQSAILPLPHAIVNNRITVAQHNQQIIYPQMQMHQPSQNNHYVIACAKFFLIYFLARFFLPFSIEFEFKHISNAH